MLDGCFQGHLRHTVATGWFARLNLLLVALSVATGAAAEDGVFREGRFEKGELRYVAGFPVLTLRGTAEEMGRQNAALTGPVVRAVADYPQRLVWLLGRQEQWPQFVATARGFLPQLPDAYRRELFTFADSAGINRDAELVANTIMDLHRGSFACSSLMVEPAKSATGAPLFGRNLDFYTLGILDKCGLVTIYRPDGKHAFAAIGFPGLVGCLSGMNDAGLALAVHEVYISADGSTMLNPKGLPYTLCFRRILEECTTIAEAETLLRGLPRTTILNLAVCDRKSAGVLEMTPDRVLLRRGEEGICVCTNHFRTRPLSVWPWCHRYSTLNQAAALESIDLTEMARKLDEANMGRLTVQTMVFEPVSLVLHLSMGKCPSSRQPLRRIELDPLFRGLPKE